MRDAAGGPAAGIDEIHLGKKAKFLTLVIDLDTGRILWVAKGRGGDALRKFWRRLRLARARVEAVACDMSAAYWSASSNTCQGRPSSSTTSTSSNWPMKIDDLRRASSARPRCSATRPQRLPLPAAHGSEKLTEDKRDRLAEALRFNNRSPPPTISRAVITRGFWA